MVVLPVLDYPGLESDAAPYDEAWTAEEIDALEEYAAGGGLLVLTNSAYRLKYGNSGLDANEDWPDANDLAGRFGLTFVEGFVPGGSADVEGDHALVQGRPQPGVERGERRALRGRGGGCAGAGPGGGDAGRHPAGLWARGRSSSWPTWPS